MSVINYLMIWIKPDKNFETAFISFMHTVYIYERTVCKDSNTIQRKSNRC